MFNICVCVSFTTKRIAAFLFQPKLLICFGGESNKNNLGQGKIDFKRSRRKLEQERRRENNKNTGETGQWAYAIQINTEQRLRFLPDSVYHENKAGYTATPVACGLTGAVFELLEHLGRSSEAKDRKNIKKVKLDRPTDQPTDGQSGV